MTRIRVQKARKIRKRASSVPLDEVARSSSFGSEVVRRLEEVLDEIDRALEAARR